MIINNDKLTIRAIEASDMDFIQALWGDAETMFTSGGQYNIRDEDKEALFDILSNGEDFNNHYIILNESTPIGDMSISKYDTESQSTKIDMKLKHSEKNKGYGRSALKSVLDYYYNTLKGNELFFEIWLVNSFAKEKLTAYGFEETLVMEDATIMTINKERYEKGVLNV